MQTNIMYVLYVLYVEQSSVTAAQLTSNCCTVIGVERKRRNNIYDNEKP